MTKVYLSPSIYRNMKRDFGRNDLADAFGFGMASLYGMPIYESRALPHQFNCSVCDGSGEGAENTYCKRCDGAGSIRIIGMMGETFITSPLPKAFQPSFPKGLVPLPPISRGLA